MTIAVTASEPIHSIREDAHEVPAGVEAASGEAAGLGRSVAIGSLIGVVLSFVFVLLGMGFAGYGWGPGAGLAAFTAFWGGIGFGSMVGGVVYLSAHEDD